MHAILVRSIRIALWDTLEHVSSKEYFVFAKLEAADFLEALRSLI